MNYMFEEKCACGASYRVEGPHEDVEEFLSPWRLRHAVACSLIGLSRVEQEAVHQRVEAELREAELRKREGKA